MIGPLHAEVLARAGLGKQDVQRELFERARRSVASLKRAGRLPGEIEPGDEDEQRCAVRRPEDVLIVCAGGTLYGYSAVVPYWIAGHESQPVTEALSRDEAGRCAVPGTGVRPTSGRHENSRPAGGAE